jgi:LPS-assembly protein
MHPRTFVFIMLLALCHPQLRGQMLTNALPLGAPRTSQPAADAQNRPLPDEPGAEVWPVARPEPLPQTGVPFRVVAGRQSWSGHVWTGTDGVEFYYRDYILRADKVTYNQDTTELETEGHVHLTGGPEDVDIEASNGEMRLNVHTARFFNVTGSMGVRRAGKNTLVYSTTNAFLFSGRVLLQTGEGAYRIVDGTMTNCRLPRPDWQLISRAIKIENGKASTTNTFFKLFGVPHFYLPYLRHPVDQTGRESGLLEPVGSLGSSIRGYTFGEQVYVVVNRSIDMVIGSEYFSKRGFAPNGDFRYKGLGLDHATARWNALLDRGIAATPPAVGKVNQGGVDIAIDGREDFSPDTRLAGTVEYLSSYVYRLVFDDNYTQAVNSDVVSNLALTHGHNGYITSGYLGRLQTFAGTAPGDEARILHLPMLRFESLDRPLGNSPLDWGLTSSLSHVSRSEPSFHFYDLGRFDFYPHVSWPIGAAGWTVAPEVAFRETFYSGSVTPDLTGASGGTPTASHDPLNRHDLEASLDLRPPALERDFAIPGWNREFRHVIEPELTYHFVGGIGSQAQNVLLIDTSDIATDTDEVGYSLTQRFYLRPLHRQTCSEVQAATTPDACSASAREWASWQVAQKFFLDPHFGGALIPGRRNVFDSTLDLSGIAYLTNPRNLSPVISRLRFEAIDNLRIEWDTDYDTRAGRLGADNLYAGYSWGRTTLGIGHALLNAVDEQGSAATTIQSQQVQPYFQYGKPGAVGFNLAANGSYDFVQRSIQYASALAVYNWGCCGINVGYRRFELGPESAGSVGRDEHEWLYGFTLANFGTVGDIRRATTPFRDPNLPPLY